MTVLIAGSLAWSVVQTQSSETAAYFSPFTRAWELAAVNGKRRTVWQRD